MTAVDERLTACIDMIGRTGAVSTQIRYSDDEQPTVWFVVAEHQTQRGFKHYEMGAALTPDQAAFRCLEALVDGGMCKHCERPTGITFDLTEQLAERLVCWYQYDPELNVFRSSCEGD